MPSFPEMQSHFNLTPFWVETLLSANFIGYCLSLFIVGNLADRYGRRPVILGGLLIFVLGSVLCVWAPNFSIILVGRFLQGVGIASPSILSFLLIADLFSLEKQQFYLAILNGIMSISFATAPILGSFIASAYHWQGNFIALLLLGLFVLAISYFFVPKHTQGKVQEVEVSYKAIFSHKPLLLLITTISFMFVPWWIFVGISPLLFMEDLGVSLANFGYYQGSHALSFAIGNIFYGLTMHKFSQKKLLNLSFILFIISACALSYISFIDSSSPLLITLVFMLFVIAQIVPTTLLFPLCLNLLPNAKGRVAAIIQGGRLILSAFALQLAGHLYTGSFQSIGCILVAFISLATITLFFALKNRPYQEAAVTGLD